jgi:hypothetical protein
MLSLLLLDASGSLGRRRALDAAERGRRRSVGAPAGAYDVVTMV